MTDAAPFALPAGRGWRYGPAAGEEDVDLGAVVKVGEQRHGRRLAVVELTTRAGEEPPDHVHATEDEFVHVIEGSVVFHCAGQDLDLTDGGCVLLPRGLEHGYRITDPGDVRMLVVTAPAPDGPAGGWGGFVADVERLWELHEQP